MMRSEKINDYERLFLEKKREEEQKTIYVTILISVFMTLAAVFGSKGKRLSLYEQYGFVSPAVIIFSILAAIFYFQYKNSIARYNKDLDLGEKIIEAYEITYKDTNMKDECLISVNTPIKKFQEHKIEKSSFAKLKIGDWITIEYFKYSQTILRIILK